MEIELRESDLIIVRWLAQKPAGRNIDEAFTKTVNDTCKIALRDIHLALKKEHSQKTLTPDAAKNKINIAITTRLSGDHLGILRSRAPLNSKGKVKWSVADNFARFQMQVLEPFAQIPHTNEDERNVLSLNSLAALRRLEGYGLETFAAASLRLLFDIGTDNLPQGQAERTRLYTSLERKDVLGDLDNLLIHHLTHLTSPRNHDGKRHFWVRPLSDPQMNLTRSKQEKMAFRRSQSKTILNG